MGEKRKGSHDGISTFICPRFPCRCMSVLSIPLFLSVIVFLFQSFVHLSNDCLPVGLYLSVSPSVLFCLSVCVCLFLFLSKFPSLFLCLFPPAGSSTHLLSLLLQTLHKTGSGFLNGERESFPFGSAVNGNAFLDVIFRRHFDVHVRECLVEGSAKGALWARTRKNTD